MNLLQTVIMSKDARERFNVFSKQVFGIDAQREGFKRYLDLVTNDLDIQIRRMERLIEDCPENEQFKEICKQLRNTQRLVVIEKSKIE